MSDDNVVDIGSDTLFYIKDDGGEIKGVGDSAGLIEFIDADNNWVGVYADGDGTIEKIKLKHLCVAWLALNYPDSLNTDDT